MFSSKINNTLNILSNHLSKHIEIKGSSTRVNNSDTVILNNIANQIIIKGSETFAKIYTADILDYKIMNQIKSLCNHPAFKNSSIRIMPDVHPSANTVVGFSAPIIQNKIIPNIIGGDIGCGMLCSKISTQGKDINFQKLDDIIRTYTSVKKEKLPISLKRISQEFKKNVNNLCQKLYKTNGDAEINKLGTIGGGNHFVELDISKNGDKFLVVHTGSRTLGKKLADYHFYSAKHQHRYQIPELSYLTDDKAQEYLRDLSIAQDYAKNNRRTILDEIIYRMGWKELDSFVSVHIYVDESGIIRKGSISANKGEKMIIPLNMRDGAILATGKGNQEWNCTAPHGAGRKIARGEVKKSLSYEDFKNSMDGIYSSCITKETLDEAPGAYKNPNDIINNIEETADIQEVIKPIYNYKD